FVSKQNTAYELETCMEFRRVLFRSTLHPPVHRAVINRHTAFGEHLLDVAVAEPVAAVPPHRPQNDVLREVSTREDTHNPTCCQRTEERRVGKRSRTRQPRHNISVNK